MTRHRRFPRKPIVTETVAQYAARAVNEYAMSVPQAERIKKVGSIVNPVERWAMATKAFGKGWHLDEPLMQLLNLWGSFAELRAANDEA